MSPEDRSLLPSPEVCRDCIHWTKYITQQVERQTCAIGKPQHEGCPWRILRTKPSGGQA